jgi:hypothetical protein
MQRLISTNNIAIGLVRVRKIRFRPTKYVFIRTIVPAYHLVILPNITCLAVVVCPPATRGQSRRRQGCPRALSPPRNRIPVEQPSSSLASWSTETQSPWPWSAGGPNRFGTHRGGSCSVTRREAVAGRPDPAMTSDAGENPPKVRRPSR